MNDPVKITVGELLDHSSAQHAEIERMKALITELQQIQDNHQNEMTRLDLQIDSLEESDVVQKALITELCDAFQKIDPHWPLGIDDQLLLQRAREATRG